jgi:short-subunit dehydrogenase
MKTDLQVVLITGASSGIGEALAVEYAEPSVHLVLLGRNLDNLQRVAHHCQAKGAQVKILQADVSEVDDLRKKMFQLDDELPVELLIANAGVTSGLGAEQWVEPWDGVKSVAEINFLGVLAAVSPITERMVARQHGQIAIMGSLSAYRGLPSCPAYSASKAGVEAYGLALRAGLAAQNVKVNVISPGYVTSAMSRQLTGPKPFLISAESAARTIKKGLANNRARISFPFPLNLGARLLALLPDRLARLILPYFAFTVEIDR